MKQASFFIRHGLGNEGVGGGCVRVIQELVTEICIVLIKAEHGHVDVSYLGQFLGEALLIPARQLRRFIVGQPEGPYLLLAQSSATMQGTASRPSFFAALYLV